MTVEEATKEVTRTSQGIATLQRILVVTEPRRAGAGAYIGKPWATEILERFPNGTFSNNQYSVKGIGPDTNTTFRENDDFVVTDVIYEGIGFSEDLLFREYVMLGRRQKILVRRTRKISVA